MQEQSRPTSATLVDCTAKSIEELEVFWSGLHDAALNEEIIKYQSHLNDVIASLKKENRKWRFVLLCFALPLPSCSHSQFWEGFC